MEHGGNVWQGQNPDGWLDFSANLRPEGMPDWVRQTLLSSISDARYYPDREMKSAREGLAAYAGVGSNQILPTAGGIEAIDLALRLYDGRVLIKSPCFSEYALRAKAIGRECADGFHDIKPNDTAIICNPNNPDGAIIERDEILKLFERLNSSSASLIVDEAFIDYCPELSVRGDVKRGFTVVGSLTKILCVPGVRLGYICADEATISRLKAIAHPWGISAFAARLASVLPEHLDEIKLYARQNESRREAFYESLKRMGFNPLRSHASFILCDFGFDAWELVGYLKSKGILVRQCASFGLSSNWLRLAVRTDNENARLLKEIATWLKY